MFYVLLCVTLCPFYFCNHLDGEERAGCFAWFVLLVSRDCCVALPHGVMGLSAVCDCGIFRSYSLHIFNLLFELPALSLKTQNQLFLTKSLLNGHSLTIQRLSYILSVTFG